MGGNVPLGYRVEARRLVPVEAEAAQVQFIFRRYLELGSIGRLLTDLRERGIATKQLVRSDIVVRGGIAFTRRPLAYLLRNRFYVGEIAFKGEVHTAKHPAILDRELFEAVQRRLTEQRNGEPVAGGRSNALLTGKLFDDRGNRMSPTHAKKAGARDRYYISRPLLDGLAIAPGQVRRVPALAIEQRILDAVRARCPSDEPDRDLVERAVERVEIGPDVIRIMLARSHDDESESFNIPWQRTPFRRHREVIASAPGNVPSRPLRVETRDVLLRAIARGRLWPAEILAGEVDGPDAIAHRESCTCRQVNATVSLASLAPAIVEKIATGTLPHGIALRDLTDPPLIWSEQRQNIGV